MFIHNLKYSLKTLLKNRALLFWTFAFPLIMALFFNMAFSGFDDTESFNPLPIAIVQNDELNSNTTFASALKALSDEESSRQIFSSSYVSEEEAIALLNDKEIIGYLVYNQDEPKIVVNNNGTDATIMKSVIDEISATIKMTNDLYEYEMTKPSFTPDLMAELYPKIMAIIEENNPHIKDTSNNNLSYITVEYYTLIAMTCLYGGTISLVSINYSLANMSNKGKRVSISPTKKGTIILSSLLASFFVQLCGVFLLFAFLYFVIKVDFGSSLPHAILLSIVGSLAGLSLGLFVASLIKKNENVKIGLIIAISMLCSFFAGMMGVVTKYYIDKYTFLNKINPANMITDGFYSLYYYDSLSRYYFNIVSLLIFSIILLLSASFVLRRQKYDSI